MHGILLYELKSTIRVHTPTAGAQHPHATPADANSSGFGA